jgi:hypothetical protein
MAVAMTWAGLCMDFMKKAQVIGLKFRSQKFDQLL